MTLQAPFPWFGGKAPVAAQVWRALIRAAGADLATPRNVREFVAWLRGHGVPVAEEWTLPGQTD